MALRRYFTIDTLREACETAYMHDFNQTITREALDDLPADGVFPVLFEFPHDGASRAAGRLTNEPHNYAHVRCIVEIQLGLLKQDTTVELFERLPLIDT